MERMDMEEMKSVGVEDHIGEVLMLKKWENWTVSTGHHERTITVFKMGDEWVCEWMNQLLELSAPHSQLLDGGSLYQQSLACGIQSELFGISLSKRQVISQMSSWKNNYKFFFYDWGYFQVFPGWSRWTYQTVSQGGLVLSSTSMLCSEKSCYGRQAEGPSFRSANPRSGSPRKLLGEKTGPRFPTHLPSCLFSNMTALMYFGHNLFLCT